MTKSVRPLQVLHLASFAGNIGDVANHAGARELFREGIGVPLEFNELEMREFYWKQRRFDADFVDMANGHDLLLIGGGNYFEVWVESSATGTSIDLAPELMARLTVPTLFYALGVDTGQGYSAGTAARFRTFMTSVLGRRDMFVSVRNDGSSRALAELISPEVAASIPVMPDNGFFAGRALGVRPKTTGKRKLIGVNVAGDMADQRYGTKDEYNAFLSNVARLCVELINLSPDVEIALVPHIWRDIVLLSELLPLIPDPHVRRRVTIAPLDTKASGLRAFLESYAEYSLVFGMRFHANVCPIGMGVPTVGLVTYPQVRLLYEELGAPERLIHVDSQSFVDDAVAFARTVIGEAGVLEPSNGVIMGQVDQQAAATLSKINAWLLDHVANRR